ncbi:MAG TPA: Crp/Fnr family transcriptional regulator [Candidatus Limnocylindrales bacterium]|jgi:CRP/FNR family transcriptional regulator|nr:Crp/Fnr family transcriptional regulator [Candidatus Limnocylindrales bacterium]
MAMAYNLQIVENCLKCAHREQRLFCDLPHDALIKLQKVKATSVYPKGTLLCLEGQPPRGIYVLCTGRAKLSTTSAEGKSIILRIAEPGEVLGLTAAVSNTPYEATIETMESSQANFISQEDFVNFLQEFPEVGIKVARQLTHNCKCAYSEIRSLGLSNSVPEKIAKLLLHWSDHPLELARKQAGEIPIRVTLTQEEIAQFVGTSRETVSRVLGDFKRRGYLRIKGATWSILNKPALENLVTT